VEVPPIVGIHGTVKFIVDNETWLTYHAPQLRVEQFDSFVTSNIIPASVKYLSSECSGHLSKHPSLNPPGWKKERICGVTV
jgi:hypothetical protein